MRAFFVVHFRPSVWQKNSNPAVDFCTRKRRVCKAPFSLSTKKNRSRRDCLSGSGMSVSKKFFDTLSNETHCVGLSFEKAAARRSALASLARLRAEKYFCRRTRRRQKCFAVYLRLRAQTLRGFFHSLKPEPERSFLRLRRINNTMYQGASPVRTASSARSAS